MRMLSLILWPVLAVAADRYPVDWKQVEPELIDRFSQLIRVDTSNPPGNETKVAKLLESMLSREGISAKLLALEPERANLVARIKGSGRKKPVVVLGHTDVVGVQRSKWAVDPFAALERNGYIYGRGTVDDKPHVAAGLMLMLLLERYHVKLDRDVIFVAEAGEEGTTRVGIDYLVEQHWDEIAAEYALAEGGATLERGGKVTQVLIGTTEKVPRGMRLVARGLAGHGSRPVRQNAVVKLAAAVSRAGSWQTPMRLNETTREYFKRLASVSAPEQAARYRALLDPAQAERVDRYFAEHEPSNYSVLRTSVVPTILKGGFRSNVIPSEAEAYLDIRALPDEDMAKFTEELRRVIAEPSVEIVPGRGGRPAAAPSRIDSEMFRALETVQRRMFPGAVTIPMMNTGATDNAQLRARGVQAYGFGPIVAPGSGGGAHSDDERIATRSLIRMLEFLWYAVLEVAAAE
jgi:acetylornithine deacetylase/succinyl-diaminopimelate desuccinylase-like protein